MPRRVFCRRPALRYSHIIRACWRRDLFPRFRGEPHAAQCKRWDSSVHHRDSYGWLRSGPLRLQSLDELPFRGGTRQSYSRGRAGRKTESTACLHRKNSSRPLERCAPAQRKRAEGHQHSSPAAHGSLRKNARRPSGRSEEHTSELQSRLHLVCRLLLEKKKKKHMHVFNEKTKKSIVKQK